MRNPFRRQQPVPASPRPPENVQVVLADGRQIPVECRYEGLDECGCHLWTAVTRLPGPVQTLTVDLLPARTAIGIGLQWELEPE